MKPIKVHISAGRVGKVLKSICGKSGARVVAVSDIDFSIDPGAVTCPKCISIKGRCEKHKE